MYNVQSLTFVISYSFRLSFYFYFFPNTMSYYLVKCWRQNEETFLVKNWPFNCQNVIELGGFQ